MYMFIIASLRVLIVAHILAAKAVKGGVFPTPCSIVSSVLLKVLHVASLAKNLKLIQLYQCICHGYTMYHFVELSVIQTNLANE